MKRDRSEFMFPGAIIQGLAKYYERQGNESTLPSLLEEFGVTEEELWSERFSFDGDKVLILLRRMDNFKSDIPVKEGLDLFSWSSTGVVGLAALSSATMQEATAVGLKFGHLYMPVIKVDIIKNKDTSAAVFSLLADFEDMNARAIELIVCGFKKVADAIADDMSGCELHFSHACSTGQSDEEASKAYSDFLNCPVFFNSDFSGFQAPNSFWERPLKNPNRVTRSMALDLIKQQHPEAVHNNVLGKRVERLLRQAAEKELFLSLNELADILHMTPRTLMRKLSKEGLRFKDILNEVRFEKAKYLLVNSENPVNVIGEQVGFKDGNAFIRAFKRAFGQTPHAWRKQSKPE